MKNDNVMLWARTLQTTKKQQTTNNLKTIRLPPPGGEPVLAYCCLGIGCELVPNMPVVEPRLLGDAALFGVSEESGLPPREFHEWLGTDGQDNEDVFLDAGDVTILLSAEVPSEGAYFLRNLGCADLNDRVGLTFSQIGDLVAYFGVRNNHGGKPPL